MSGKKGLFAKADPQLVAEEYFMDKIMLELNCIYWISAVGVQRCNKGIAITDLKMENIMYDFAQERTTLIDAIFLTGGNTWEDKLKQVKRWAMNAFLHSGPETDIFTTPSGMWNWDWQRLKKRGIAFDVFGLQELNGGYDASSPHLKEFAKKAGIGLDYAEVKKFSEGQKSKYDKVFQQCSRLGFKSNSW